MTTAAAQRSLSPSVASLVATLAVVICLAGFARTFNHSFRANDDMVYLYLTGIELAHAAQTEPLHRIVGEYLSQQRVGERVMARWRLREDYARNYLLPSALIYASSRLLKSVVFGFQANYGLFVVLSLALGVTLSFVIGLAVLRFVIASASDAASAFGALLGLGISALFLLVPEDRILSLSMTDNAWDALRHLVRVFFSPTSEYSIFGYTPRNQFYLCAMAVFLLRWRGSIHAAYALTIGLTLFHLSMAGLLLMLLVAIDVVARPKIFDRWTIALVVFGVALFLSRETLFTTLGLWPLTIVAGTAAVAAVGSVVAYRSGMRLPWLQAFDHGVAVPVRAWLDGRGPIGADLVLAFGLWLVTLPLAVLAAAFGDPAVAYHFWGEIHIRVLALLQPAILIGLSILAVGWLGDTLDRRWLYASVAIIAVLAALPAAVQAVSQYDAGLVRAASALNRYNGFIGKPLPAVDLQTGEAVVYYAIAMEIDLQSKIVEQMLFRWPAPPGQ